MALIHFFFIKKLRICEKLFFILYHRKVLVALLVQVKYEFPKKAIHVVLLFIQFIDLQTDFLCL